MSDARIGVIGKILSGDHQGFFVKILDDTQGTGGYYILLSSEVNFDTSGEGYDLWYESYDIVKLHFSKLSIEWLEDTKI